MREIKFRIWDMDRKVMLDSQGIIFYYGDFYESYRDLEDGIALDNIEVMQSTGLVDKHGVKIYENDLLKCTSKIYTNLGATRTGEYEETIKQVIWKDDSWGTRVISSNLTSKGSEKSGLVISAKYAEVIGDIYQNKDLLEG